MALLSDDAIGLGGSKGGLLSDDAVGLKAAPEAKAPADLSQTFSSFGEPVQGQAPKPAPLHELPVFDPARYGETQGGAVTGRSKGRSTKRADVSEEFLGKDPVSSALGTAAQASDMFTSAGKQLLGAASYWSTRTYAKAVGESDKIAALAGQEAKDYFFPPEISTPWAKVAERLGPAAQEAYNNNPLAWVGGKISTALEDGVKVAAEQSGLQKEDFIAMADQFMGSALHSQIKGQVKAAWEQRKTEAAKKQTVADKAAEVQQMAKAGPQESARQVVAGKPHLRGPEAEIALKDSARKAFPDDQDYASHLNFLEEEKLNDAETPTKPKLSAEETKAYLDAQKGAVDPKLLKWLGIGAGGAAVGIGASELYKYWQDKELHDKQYGTPGINVDPDKMQPAPVGTPAAGFPDWEKLAMGGAAVFGSMKAKGGMWHPEAVERLAESIAETPRATPHNVETPGGATLEAARLDMKAQADWAKTATARYLNKHAGTPTDPLKDVEVPHGEGTSRWEELTDKAFTGTKNETGVELGGTRKGEMLWHEDRSTPAAISSSHALTSYLSHVGDYLRAHVPAEKLGQYDLVRAVKETQKWDAELAKNMEKAQLDDTKGSPVYKDYGDGMRWIQLTKPGQFARESDAMGHSVRGYEPPKGVPEGSNLREGEGKHPDWIEASGDSGHPSYGLGGWEAIKSGDAKVYSLRDAKGKSHVTVEVQGKFNPEGLLDPSQMMKPHAHPELESITQIKGKQNRAPSAEYLPYVQDFVKGGKWGEVWDLENTGLHKVGEHLLDEAEFDNAALKHGTAGPHGVDWAASLRRHLAQGVSAEEARANWLHGAREGTVNIRLPKDFVPSRERGSVDPKLLARMAAVGVGGFVGSQIAENPKEGAFWGALAGAALGHTSPARTVAGIKKIFEADKRLRVDDLANAHEVAIERSGRVIWQLQKGIEKLVPKAECRAAITHAIESNDLSGLSPSEKAAATVVKQFFSQMKQAGLDSKVLKDSLENYVTHLWGKDAKTQGVLAEVFGDRASGPSMSPNSRFALRRSVPTIAEGKAKGMTPVTEDISAIMGIYGNSIVRAMENKRLLTTLKDTKIGDSKASFVMPLDKAPPGYKRVNSPQLAGLLVHPDIVPSMRFLFDNPNPGVAMRALEGVNTAVKRSAVSLSLFHAKALTDALIGATTNPLTVGKTLVTSALGTNKYLKMLREGGAGDLVDKAILGGLKFTKEGSKLADEDVNGSFYGMLKDLQGLADKTIPGSGLLVKGYTKLNHAVDTLMWERLHAGMKLSTFAEKYEALLENNTKAHLRAPAKNPLRSEKEVAEAAASFTNDIFGGLNWRRVAESARTRWGRDLALSLASPTGRRGLQLALFAPDWTISTTRAAIKAFGPAGTTVAGGALIGHLLAPDDKKLLGAGIGALAGLGAARAGGLKTGGSGIRGLWEAKTVEDLHRQYILRSALYYVAVGDAINYSMSGHHLWDNKDPTTIDMGDGRTMQWSKHTMEPVHWMTKPGQQALNKLGVVPKELATQALGTEYLTTSGRSPPIASRLGHLAKNLEPIVVQQGEEGDWGSGISGFLGAPIYGKTYAERDAIKESQRLRKRMGVR